MAKDPVCVMIVNVKMTEYKSSYKGNTYYFSNRHRKMSFDENPEEYIE